MNIGITVDVTVSNQNGRRTHRQWPHQRLSTFVVLKSACREILMSARLSPRSRPEMLGLARRRAYCCILGRVSTRHLAGCLQGIEPLFSHNNFFILNEHVWRASDQGLLNYRHLKITIPIPIPFEYDDTDTDINAGWRKSYSFDRQHAKNSMTFNYPANLRG